MNGEISSYVDISQQANDSVSINAARMLKVDNYLYVACQVKEKSEAETLKGSLVLKIDTQTDFVVEKFRCNYNNVTDLDYSDGTLYVTNSGSSYNIDGAVEKIDLASKVITPIVTGKELGRDLVEIAIDKDEQIIYGATQCESLEPGVFKYSMDDFSILMEFDITEAVSLDFNNYSRMLTFGNTGGLIGAIPELVTYNSLTNSITSVAVRLAPISIAVLSY